MFSWSYRALSTDAARLFRLLGVHPGPDISGPAAASLAGVPRVQARGLLAELTRAHLLSEPSPGRFRLHDLLRAYAAELAAADPGEQQAARCRLLDHYLHTAHPASALISTARQPITLTVADDTVTPELIDDAERAYAWFTVEDPILVAAISLAVDHGFDQHAWQLQWSISPYLGRRRTPQVEIDTLLLAIGAAERLGDRSMNARQLNGLALAYLRGGDFDAAHRCLARALDLFTDLGDAVGRSRIHATIAAILLDEGRLSEALDHAREAHAIIESTGDHHRDERRAYGDHHGVPRARRVTAGHPPQRVGDPELRRDWAIPPPPAGRGSFWAEPITSLAITPKRLPV